MRNAPGGITFPHLELWYGTTLVGRVTGAFCSDETWYGDFEPGWELSAPEDATSGRLAEYIRFTEDFLDRTRRDPDHPPDAEEFDAFSDVVHSGRWCARTPDGGLLPIEYAPTFWPGGEVSWRPP